LLLAISLPNIFFLQKSCVKLELNKLASIFNYTRKLAISTNTNINIKFNLNNNSYNYKNITEKINKNIKFGFAKNTYGPPSNPVNKLIKPVTFENNIAKISSSGICSPGTIYLTDSKNQNTYAIAIPISQNFKIRKYIYLDSKSWSIIS